MIRLIYQKQNVQKTETESMGAFLESLMLCLPDIHLLMFPKRLWLDMLYQMFHRPLLRTYMRNFNQEHLFDRVAILTGTWLHPGIPVII